MSLTFLSFLVLMKDHFQYCPTGEYRKDKSVKNQLLLKCSKRNVLKCSQMLEILMSKKKPPPICNFFPNATTLYNSIISGNSAPSYPVMYIHPVTIPYHIQRLHLYQAKNSIWNACTVIWEKALKASKSVITLLNFNHLRALTTV